MKPFLAAILAAFLLASAPHAAIVKASDSTVVVAGTMKVSARADGFGVVLREPDKLDKYCSGVVVARSTNKELAILTAGHCSQETIEEGAGPFGSDLVSDPTPVYVQFFDGDVGRVVNVISDPDDDLSLLIVKSQRLHPFVNLNTRNIDAGQPLFSYGMPNGYSWSYMDAVSMRGSVYAMDGDMWDYTYMISCPSCAPGDSGGGVFNYSSDLVGTEVAGEEYGINFMVPAVRITVFLNDAL